MKIILSSLLFLLCNVCYAQQTNKIDFVKGLSWTQIKKKAKAENKYIFLDGFTTWCGPCKEMEMKIFPNTEVVEFFNKSFINVSVQFDKTLKDNEEIKARYADADSLKKMYEIDSYPTYLFFNPEAQLVHKIMGASYDAKEFISKAKLALDPKTQYSSLKVLFEKGERDTLLLKKLIDIAISSDLKSLPNYANLYLSRINSEYYKNNLLLIYRGTSKTSDFGFKLLTKYSKEIDSLYGHREAQKKIIDVIFEEDIFSCLKINGAITKYSGGMVFYVGDNNPKVNWKDIEHLVVKKYPEMINEIMMYSKFQYYSWASDWMEYSKVVDYYLNDNKTEIDSQQLSNFSKTVFENCNNEVILRNAIDWLKVAMNKPKSNPFKINHIMAELMYKLGDKELAIKQMEEVVKSYGQIKWLNDELTKMKSGAKTWQN